MSFSVLQGSPEVTPADEYSKGVVFYLREKKIVGVLTWNCFGKMDVARKVHTGLCVCQLIIPFL